MNKDLFGSLKNIAGCRDPPFLPNKLESWRPHHNRKKTLLPTQCREASSLLKKKTLSDANKTTIFSVGQSLNFGEERGPAITGEKIHTSVFESNTDSASGADGLSAELIPFSYSIIANHLSLIFNSCLSLGYFPVAWKRARICVLKK